MSTARKPLAGSVVKTARSNALSVVKRQDGRFLIGGTDERKLVNPGSKVVTKTALRSTRHLSAPEIRAFAKRMKVAT